MAVRSAADGAFGGKLDGDGRDYLAADGAAGRLFPRLGVLLVSSIAGVIVHIPAGIGVLEAVFIAMLSAESISRGAIIAALLAARAVLLLPLLIATVGYLLLESRAKTLRERNQRKLADG